MRDVSLGRWSSVVVLILGAVLFLGCDKHADSGPTGAASASPSASGTPPLGKAGAVVAEYLSKAKYAERAPFILRPEINIPLMIKETGSDLDGVPRYKTITESSSCAQTSVHGGCNVDVVFDDGPFSYCVSRIADQQWKVDWKCSKGYSAMSLAEYKATQPTKPLTFRILGMLDDYYNYDFANAKKTHYSVRLNKPDDANSIHGYMLKTAKGAEQLFNVLKDGKGHYIIVEFRYPNGSRDSSVTEITRFVGNGWVETPDGE